MVTGTRRANFTLLFRTPVVGYKQVPCCLPSSCTVMTGTALSPSGCFGEAIFLFPFASAAQELGRSVSQAQRACLYCNMHQPRKSSGIQEHFFKAAVEVCALHSSVDILECAALPPAMSVSNALSPPFAARKSLGLPGRLPPSTVTPQQHPPLSGGHSGLGTGAMVARSSDLPYLIVGVVLGSIVLLIVAFIPFCLWRAWSKQSKGSFLRPDVQDMLCPVGSWVKHPKCEGCTFWKGGRGWAEGKSQMSCVTQ